MNGQGKTTVRFALRILGYLIGAMAVLQFAIGAAGIVSIIFRTGAMGYMEVLISLCTGIVLSALAAALFRLSRPKTEAEPRSGQ